MRIILAIVSLIALLAQTLDKTLVVTAYEVNKAYIASTLCENRDKPELHCNGQCVLAKKLKEASDQSEEPAPIQFEERQEIPQLLISFTFDLSNSSNELAPIVSRNNQWSDQAILNRIFHPPRHMTASLV